MNDNKLATPQLCRGIRLALEMFRRWPWILVVLVLLPFGLIAAAASLNYNGFCIGQHRFLPDDVFLRAAIEDTILMDAALPVSVGYRDSKEQFVKSIPYRGISDFQAQNPRCCEILTKLPLEYPEISAIDRFLGAASKTVAVTYFRRYRDDDGSIATRTKTSYVTIGNCGAVFNIGR